MVPVLEGFFGESPAVPAGYASARGLEHPWFRLPALPSLGLGAGHTVVKMLWVQPAG